MILRIYKILRILFLILVSIISLYASKFYEGSVFIYGVYCSSLIGMIFYLTDRKSSYFEIFFSSYLFLGFWFKYVFSLMLYNGLIFESGNINSKNIDDILMIGSLVAITCIVASFACKKIRNRNFVKKVETKEQSFFEIFYLNNRILILSFFSISVVTAALINYQFGLYQRGFITLSDVPNFFQNLFKWVLLFGFTTFSCFLIHVEILNQKKINFYTVIISLFEILFSYTSMLSRSFVINALSLILPLYQKSLKLKKNYNKFFYILFIITLLSTLISLYATNYFRLTKIDALGEKVISTSVATIPLEISSDGIPADQTIENFSSEKVSDTINNKPLATNSNTVKKVTSNDITKFLIINRWIGIDSLILVHNSGKTSFNLFLQSLREEKKLNTEHTFYEKTFGLSYKINFSTNKVLLKGNTLPGIITFLYYSGNLYFVLISLFSIIIIFNIFELMVKKITHSNLIFACFLSNMIATRLFHFGYAPKESYLFVMSFLLSVVLMVFLLKFKFLFINRK